VEIAEAARKHGIADSDIRARGSQTRFACSTTRIVTSTSEPDRAGRLLEVVVLDDGGQPVAIHAMVLRRRFYDQL